MQNPLGPYGNAVAAVAALLSIAAFLASHLFAGVFVPSDALDAVGYLALGTVLGTQVVQNGTQMKATNALALAGKLARRLDAADVPDVPAARVDDPPVTP